MKNSLYRWKIDHIAVVFSNSIILSKRTYMYLQILHVCFCYHNFITVIGLSASTQQWSHYSKKTLRHVDCCSNNICNTYFIHTSNFFWLWHVLVLYCVFLFFHAIMYVFCACVEIYTSTSSYVYLPFTRPLHTHFWSFYWQHGMNFPFLSDFKCKYSSRRRRIRDTAVWCIFDPFKVCLLV